MRDQSQAPPAFSLAIACLTCANADGFTDSSRKPHDSNAGTQRVSPAISPHKLTAILARLPYSTVRRINSRIDGCSGSLNLSSAPFVRSQAVRYWARSFEPIEKNDARN